MLLKRTGLWLLLILIVGLVFGWKVWRQHSASDVQPLSEIKGPAVIMFRGDNDPGCQTIYHLVDEAATRHGTQIQFIQLEWSDNNPLIKKYQIRFLPSVVFVDKQDKEIDRIVGESPAVQQKLQQRLAHIDELLLQ